MTESSHPATPEADSKDRKDHGEARELLSGSSVLFIGKCLSLSLNFVRNVLIARYLTTGDFGAFTYALSAVVFLETFSTLGLKTTIPRFIPIFHEKGEARKAMAVLSLGLAMVLISGSLIILLYFEFPSLARSLVEDSTPLVFLSILIFLVPLEALDVILINLFASFGDIRGLFLRKFALGPVLRLTVVLLLVLVDGSIYFLAYGYLIAGIIATATAFHLALRLLRRKDLLGYLQINFLQSTPREVFIFTVPAITSEIAPKVMASLTVILIGFFHSSEEVALFTVVMPLANLNYIVTASLLPLFLPTIAKMFARSREKEILDLYWQTATWIALFSFPIFGMTFAASEQTVQFFFGAKYAGAGTTLTLLAFGIFVNELLGFNHEIIKVLGKVKFLIAIDLTAILTSITLSLLLIPQQGAIGAALSYAGTLLILNLFRQVGLRHFLGQPFLDPRYLRLARPVGMAILIFLADLLLGPFDFWILAAAVGLSMLLLLWLFRRSLKIFEIFPELENYPLIRKLSA